MIIDTRRKVAKASWERIHERRVDRSVVLDQAGTNRQIAAFQQWLSGERTNSPERLHELKMPIFVAPVVADVLVPVHNILILYQKISNLCLAVEPADGHGLLSHYARTFVAHVHSFLDEKGMAVACS